MAATYEDSRGVVIELDHGETDRLLQAIEGGGDLKTGLSTLLVTLGVGGAVAAVIGAALAVHVAWEKAWIKASDAGEGVILTCPVNWWASGAIPPIVIVSRRYAPDYGKGWTAGDGTFVSPGGDRVEHHIDHGAVDPEIVTFRLRNQCQSGWDKAFILRDGEGSQWFVRASTNAQGQESLWAYQTKNGQQFSFEKPGFLGQWIRVLSVGELDPLQGGDLVTFTWVRD